MNTDANKYKLSKSNKILVTTIILFITVGYFGYATITPYNLGRYIGTLLALYLIPLFFGKLAWRFSKNNKAKSSSLAFNFVLCILILGQSSALVRISENNQGMREVASTKNALHEAINNSEDEKIIGSKLKAHQDSVVNLIKIDAKHRKGVDKKLNDVMALKIKQSYQIQNDWMHAMFDTPVLDNFDFSIIHKSDDYTHQLELLDTYIIKTKDYKFFLENFISEFKLQFTAEEKELDVFKSYLRGVNKEMAENMKPALIDSHLAYGEMMKELLILLGENQDKWRIKDEVIVVDDNMLETVKSLSDNIFNKGIEIAKLTNEIE